MTAEHNINQAQLYYEIREQFTEMRESFSAERTAYLELLLSLEGVPVSASYRFRYVKEPGEFGRGGHLTDLLQPVDRQAVKVVISEVGESNLGVRIVRENGSPNNFVEIVAFDDFELLEISSNNAN